MERTLSDSFKTSLTRGLGALVFIAAAGLSAKRLMPKHLCEGFLPPNNMKIPVGSRVRSNFFSAKSAGGLTEQQFNDVMDRVQKIYGPVVAQAGGTLTINRKWTDPTVNASAEQAGSSWILNMYGGLARHQETTFEGMALVACHELGHHLGGAPKTQSWFGDDWATDEGGADYFATLKCLRNFFAEDDNAAILKSVQLDPFGVARCESEFKGDQDRLLCERSLMATMSVSRLFMDLHQEAKAPQFSTPDPTVVAVMDDPNADDPHPPTQCRMDTYFNGATCHVDKTVSNSKTDFRQGACIQGVDTYGWRPLCWFKPD